MQVTSKINTLIPFAQLEPDAVKQVTDAAEHDFVHKIAVMPDCHFGYSLPIGAAALLEGVISPDYVGYDIGCGMNWLCTHMTKTDVTHEYLRDLLDKLKATIPVGFNWHDHPVQYENFTNASRNYELNKKVKSRLNNQVGTLGGGNHFIELGKDLVGDIYIVIHSGSRNIGHSIADFYMKHSKTEDKEVPNGFLLADSELGQAYITDMNFAMDYAAANRKALMVSVLAAMGFSEPQLPIIESEHHNHAIRVSKGLVEDPNGKYWLHRKGATQANSGQYGVIPGNMRDGTYITKGKGNATYLNSASHGAGRRMSRTKAKKLTTLPNLQAEMSNVMCDLTVGMLDEGPHAYKDLATVINMQEPVVEIVNHITPLLNLKG